MPMPGPMSSQFRRSLGRPSASRGYHFNGTETLRPSAKSTTSVSPVTRTCFATTVSVARLEVPHAMPSPMLFDAPRPAATPSQVRSEQTRGYGQGRPVAARTWQFSGRVPRECAPVRPGRSKRRRNDMDRSGGPSGSRPRLCQLSGKPATLVQIRLTSIRLQTDPEARKSLAQNHPASYAPAVEHPLVSVNASRRAAPTGDPGYARRPHISAAQPEPRSGYVRRLRWLGTRWKRRQLPDHAKCFDLRALTPQGCLRLCASSTPIRAHSRSTGLRTPNPPRLRTCV